MKNAFDSIWGEGLIYKLIQLGINGNLLKILYSFFTDRKNKVLFNNKTSSPFNIQAGTPQGSVLSPTLFNLMLQDIPLDENINTYVYADDITISATNKNPQVAKENLQNYLDIFSAWTKEWGLKINPEKSVMQYFTRKRILNIPSLTIDNSLINYKSSHMCLGMVLDSPKLAWKDHIQYLILDCQRRLDLLKIISSPVWGASFKILRQTYISYIRSKIAYGSILYDSSNSPLLKKLEVIQNTALRLILGARKTSPILSLQVEANIPPLILHRGILTLKNYSKISHRPSNFPTKTRLELDKILPQYPNFKDSFAYRVAFWLEVFKINPIEPSSIGLISPIPPWKKVTHNITTCYDYKNEIKNDSSFSQYLTTSFPNHEAIFTDGSKTDTPVSTACAIYVSFRSKSYSWKLHPSHSVLSSELFAIFKALEFASFDQTKNYIILSDSRTALLLIKDQNPETHQAIVFKIQCLLQAMNNITSVHLHWVKGHSGILGNERADRAANYGHSLNNIFFFPLPPTTFISTLKSEFISYWEQYWKNSVNETNKGKFLMNIRKGSIKPNNIIYNSLNRREQVLLTRLRIGHAGVQAYLNRFNITQDTICPNCEQSPETIEHFFYFCEAFDIERRSLELKLDNIEFPIHSLSNLLAGNPSLDNLSISKAVLTFINDTGKNMSL